MNPRSVSHPLECPLGRSTESGLQLSRPPRRPHDERQPRFPILGARNAHARSHLERGLGGPSRLRAGPSARFSNSANQGRTDTLSVCCSWEMRHRDFRHRAASLDFAARTDDLQMQDRSTGWSRVPTLTPRTVIHSAYDFAAQPTGCCRWRPCRPTPWPPGSSASGLSDSATGRQHIAVILNLHILSGV